jgi:hypothetical protein
MDGRARSFGKRSKSIAMRWSIEHQAAAVLHRPAAVHSTPAVRQGIRR